MSRRKGVRWGEIVWVGDKSSVVDPDPNPNWIPTGTYSATLRIRIRIPNMIRINRRIRYDSNLGQKSGSGSHMDPQH